MILTKKRKNIEIIKLLLLLTLSYHANFHLSYFIKFKKGNIKNVNTSDECSMYIAHTKHHMIHKNKKRRI